MAAVETTVSVEAVTYTHGHWCRECWLPSGVCGVLVFTLGGTSTLRNFYRCEKCGGDQIDPVAQP